MWYNSTKEDYSYFANSIFKIGDVLGKVDHNLADKISNCKIGARPIGISMVHMVDIDVAYYNMFSKYTLPKGHKIAIMTKGSIMQQWNIDLPCHQPVYIDLNTSLLSWKYSPYKVGYLSSDIDKDGFVKINFDFERL